MFTYRAEEFPLDLEFGWNLVSFHAKPLYDWHYDFLIPGFGPVYERNAQSQSYNVPDRLETGRGYWIRAVKDETVAVWGVQRASWSHSVASGWNMIAGPHTAIPLSDLAAYDCLLLDHVYWWNHTGKEYVHLESDDYLEPGKAYWIVSTAECTITLPAP